MLRISKKADYAVFLLGAIARQGAYPGGTAADTVVSAHDLAKQAGLNKSVVANLLKEFSRHGILESVRGLRGGYRLASPPNAISLGQILEVVEGKLALVECVPHPASFLEEDATPSNEGASEACPPTSPQTDASQSIQTKHDERCCSLINFCPSKQPLKIVHERISQLFADIHLDELCSMTPVANATTASATSNSQATINGGN
jgi:Rrf2 family protein